MEAQRCKSAEARRKGEGKGEGTEKRGRGEGDKRHTTQGAHNSAGPVFKDPLLGGGQR